MKSLAKTHGRYIYGEGVAGHMTLDEVLALERQLEMWLYHTRSAKVRGHRIASCFDIPNINLQDSRSV